MATSAETISTDPMGQSPIDTANTPETTPEAQDEVKPTHTSSVAPAMVDDDRGRPEPNNGSAPPQTLATAPIGTGAAAGMDQPMTTVIDAQDAQRINANLANLADGSMTIAR